MGSRSGFGMESNAGGIAHDFVALRSNSDGDSSDIGASGEGDDTTRPEINHDHDHVIWIDIGNGIKIILIIKLVFFNIMIMVFS